MERPVLSVVAAVVSDTIGPPNADHLEACLAALVVQKNAPPMEILVPYLPSTAGIAPLRERYPEARFIEARNLRLYAGASGSREHHDELRARGLAEARGAIVALIEDHGIAAEDWAAQIVESHRGEAAAIGGAIENGIDRPLNWAVFFCDFLRYQPPFPKGDSPIASDANVSYKRAALESVSSVWAEVFHESSVNSALRRRGERVALDPAVRVFQRRQGLTVASALQERFVWGRSYAATRAGLAPASKRLFWLAFAPALPALMLARMTVMAWKKRRTFKAFLRAFPLTAALTVSWSCGEFTGYLTRKANAEGAQAAEAISRGQAS
ncbi:MAG TPA: hypothetical protein VKV74_05900 [Bryobacteraceae bacterium]|nr:hypothetical protein [Bryobacteraceae bacterium]